MPLTDTARRVLAPGYYTEYSKLVGDALALQKSELDRQADIFRLERARVEAGQADRDRVMEEASRAALTNVTTELAALDPNDPQYAQRRVEVLARNPEALYNRSTGTFLGMTSDASAEARNIREQQRQQEIYAKREEEQQAAQQKRADDSFARQVALRSGRRDFYDNWRLKYDTAKTEEDRRKVTDDLGWQDQQWDFEQKLIEAGVDPEPLKEPTPDKKGTFLGEKARKALIAASAQKAKMSQFLESSRLLASLRREKADAMDPIKNPVPNQSVLDDLDAQIRQIESISGNFNKPGAASRYMPSSAAAAASMEKQGTARSKF